MANISAIERFIEIVQTDKKPTLRMSDFLEQITRRVNLNTVLSGSGTPEAVITAEPTTLYMDTAGGAGTILYVKQSGAGNTGWILV